MGDACLMWRGGDGGEGWGEVEEVDLVIYK